MGVYIFGRGRGWLPVAAGEIAREHGARLVNYTVAQCSCGYGCPPGTCEVSKRHWFFCHNFGNPYNSVRRNAVMAALQAAKLSVLASAYVDPLDTCDRCHATISVSDQICIGDPANDGTLEYICPDCYDSDEEAQDV